VIEEIARITQRVIGDGSVDDFLPTLIDFETRTVSVLEGIPADADPKSAIRDWLTGHNVTTYGVAFCNGDEIHLTAIAPTGRKFAALARIEGAWQISDADDVLRLG